MDDGDDGEQVEQEAYAAQKAIVTQNEEEDDDNFMQLMDQIGAQNVFDELRHNILTIQYQNVNIINIKLK